MQLTYSCLKTNHASLRSSRQTYSIVQLLFVGSGTANMQTASFNYCGRGFGKMYFPGNIESLKLCLLQGQLLGVALSFLRNFGILSGASGVLGALSSGVASAALDDRFAVQRAQQKQVNPTCLPHSNIVLHALAMLQLVCHLSPAEHVTGSSSRIWSETRD